VAALDVTPAQGLVTPDGSVQGEPLGLQITPRAVVDAVPTPSGFDLLVRRRDSRTATTVTLPVPTGQTLQLFSVDDGADKALVITQDSAEVMHSMVMALPSGRVIAQFTATSKPTAHNTYVGVLSPDGRSAAYAVDDHRIAILRAPKWTAVNSVEVRFRPPAGDQHLISPIAFDRHGRLLVLGWHPPPDASSDADDQVVALVDPRTGKLLGQADGFGVLGLVDANDWSRDGRRLAVGTLAGTVRVLDASDLHPLSDTVVAAAGYVQTVSFSPDGRTLVTGGSDGTLRLWDGTTLRPIGSEIRARVPGSWWAWYRLDGTLVGLTPLADSTEQGFSMPAEPVQWMHAACRLAGGPMSSAEWAREVGSGTPDPHACASRAG
jgi:WD40 repeat protein